MYTTTIAEFPTLIQYFVAGPPIGLIAIVCPEAPLEFHPARRCRFRWTLGPLRRGRGAGAGRARGGRGGAAAVPAGISPDAPPPPPLDSRPTPAGARGGRGGAAADPAARAAAAAEGGEGRSGGGQRGWRGCGWGGLARHAAARAPSAAATLPIHPGLYHYISIHPSIRCSIHPAKSQYI